MGLIVLKQENHEKELVTNMIKNSLSQLNKL